MVWLNPNVASLITRFWLLAVHAIADSAGTVGVKRGIAADVDSAVIAVQKGVLVHPSLETVVGATGVDGTEGAVGSNNEIRRLSKQIPALAIAIEVVRYETDILRDGDIEADLKSGALWWYAKRTARKDWRS